MEVKKELNPDENPADRLKICKDCDKFFLPTRTCKVCGCFMFIKARIKSQSCPIGKW